MKAHRPFLLIPGAVLFACSPETPVPPPQPAAPPPAAIEPASATATLVGKSGREVTGELQLTVAEGGVMITGEVRGLTPDTEHGFHVHETGDCSAPDASSAGGHFNPTGAEHGDPTAVQPSENHLGDIPNIIANDTGTAPVSTAVPRATLRDAGNFDLIGKALVVHARPDDYTTQPAGGSGDRIACGVIR
jgi:Cu-Zn family superoxide dismutase